MEAETLNKLIATRGLNVFQQDSCILQNVNIQIDLGEFIYIIGKVGSGKTSFLKTLYAELPVLEGEVIVADFDLYKIKKNQIPLLRRKIGMVFQDLELLNDRNVFENLKFVLKATGWKKQKEIKKRILEVLDIVGLNDKVNLFPKQLSGGEKQSLNIARAILNNPPLIFADEPTTNLDPESVDTVINLLYQLAKTGITVIVVTHNYSLLDKYKGRILLCKDHKITEINNNDNFEDLK